MTRKSFRLFSSDDANNEEAESEDEVSEDEVEIDGDDGMRSQQAPAGTLRKTFHFNEHSIYGLLGFTFVL